MNSSAQTTKAFASGGSSGQGYQDQYTTAYNKMQQEAGGTQFLQAYTGPRGETYYNYTGQPAQTNPLIPAAQDPAALTPTAGPTDTSSSAPSTPTVLDPSKGANNSEGGGTNGPGGNPTGGNVGSISGHNVGLGLGAIAGIGLGVPGLSAVGATIGDIADNQSDFSGLSAGQVASGLAHNATLGLSDKLGTQSIGKSVAQNDLSTPQAMGIGVPSSSEDIGNSNTNGGAPAPGSGDVGDSSGATGGDPNGGQGGNGDSGTGGFSKGGNMSAHQGFLAHPGVHDALLKGPMGQGFAQGGVQDKIKQIGSLQSDRAASDRGEKAAGSAGSSFGSMVKTPGGGNNSGTGYADGGTTPGVEGFATQNAAAIKPQGMAQGGQMGMDTVSTGFASGGMSPSPTTGDGYPDAGNATDNQTNTNDMGSGSGNNQQSGVNQTPNGFSQTPGAYQNNFDAFSQDDPQNGADGQNPMGGPPTAGFAKGGMHYDGGGPVIQPGAQPTNPGTTPGDPSAPDNSQVSAVTQPEGATKDDQPAMLSKGEYVVDAATVAFFGVNQFKKMQLQAHKSMMEQAQGEQQAQPQQGGLGSPQGQQAQPTPPMPAGPPPNQVPNGAEARIAQTNTPHGGPPMSSSMMGV